MRLLANQVRQLPSGETVAAASAHSMQDNFDRVGKNPFAKKLLCSLHLHTCLILLHAAAGLVGGG